MPPAHQCVNTFDVHVALDADNSVRVGGTDTLNTAVAPSQDFYFHPTTSPFHMTDVLTTYSKVTSSNGCVLDVGYDVKIRPRFGFHTGAITIMAHSGCSAGDCINFEFLESRYDAAGKCRIRFSEECASTGDSGG